MDSAFTRWLSVAAITMIVIMTSQAQAQKLCSVSAKDAAQLTMDERDNSRLKCLKKHAARLDRSTCLKMANTMEYATNADEARQVCLFELSRTPTGKECLRVTRLMELPDVSDDARWSCLLREERKMNRKTCLTLAKEMNYPANQQRAHIFCTQEVSE